MRNTTRLLVAAKSQYPNFRLWLRSCVTKVDDSTHVEPPWICSQATDFVLLRGEARPMIERASQADTLPLCFFHMLEGGFHLRSLQITAAA